MSKFVAVRTIKLDFIEPTDKWADCYLQIASLSVGEIEKIASADVDNKDSGLNLIRLLEEKFISGKGWNGTEVVDIKKEDIKELPIEVFQGLFIKLISELPKKK